MSTSPAAASQPAGLTINAAICSIPTGLNPGGKLGVHYPCSSANAARSWATSFNDLTLALTGSGDFALTDSNAL